MGKIISILLCATVYVLLFAIFLRICSVNTCSLSPEMQRLEDDAQYAWVCEQEELKRERELIRFQNKKGRRK